MKRLLLGLPLLAILTTACQKPTPDLTPKYEGQYQLQFTTQTDFDNTPVTTTTTSRGSLTIAKNADGTYTFTEKRPNADIERSYQVILVGTRFEVPIQTESFPVNGVSYTPQFMGTGELKTNSVTITRTASFTAGSVRVNSTFVSYGYR
ncbi:hypothetical protein GO730_21740 [Spirosoma sp. HMF3257]|uniref:Lipocalin-like domain-containing protein n=1 Tax=Spirosoma telluris TaxID=2183553 RepID=A0A327NTS1_9BACT|nr:hypothetical protein [Spirosoma telluris]RAI76138.1 hypothetical protein HMF3257_21660 [Spirosoma telluris]